VLDDRVRRRAWLDVGEMPDFLPNPIQSRDSDWRVAQAPPDFDDRRVEITGPAEPKMLINAQLGRIGLHGRLRGQPLPHWDNVVTGHWAVSEAVRRRLNFQTDGPTAPGKNARPGVLRWCPTTSP